MDRMTSTVRTMDIHLLTSVDDDGSPFGVEYSTRRLILESSGEVSCDDPKDAMWQELAAGIPSPEPRGDKMITPSAGAPLLDSVAGYFRYHFLRPLVPLVYDWRGPARPDNFRIVWQSSARLDGGHGYLFLCERSDTGAPENGDPLLPVANIDGWSFFHEFGGLEPLPFQRERQRARVVSVNLLPLRSAHWRKTVLGPNAGPRETKAFIRAFLRRFFERQNAGIRLDPAPGLFRQGPFAWVGGF